MLSGSGYQPASSGQPGGQNVQRTLLKSKIHRATVTGADIDYVGSLTLDPELIAATDLVENERIEIYNITNGERLATYVITGGPGDVIANGAAAHHVRAGDLVIICSYATYSEQEVKCHQPRVVMVDSRNRILPGMGTHSPAEHSGPSSSLPYDAGAQALATAGTASGASRE